VVFAAGEIDLALPLAPLLSILDVGFCE
jgi:hypothetical protein